MCTRVSFSLLPHELHGGTITAETLQFNRNSFDSSTSKMQPAVTLPVCIPPLCGPLLMITLFKELLKNMLHFIISCTLALLPIFCASNNINQCRYTMNSGVQSSSLKTHSTDFLVALVCIKHYAC